MKSEIHGKFNAKVNFIDQFRVRIKLSNNTYIAGFASNKNYLITATGDDHFLRLMSASFSLYMDPVPFPDFNAAVKKINISLYSDEYEMMLYLTPEQNATEERLRIGARIKELRQKQNIDAKTLALRAGIDASNLSRIEQGHYSVGLDILAKIANALNARVEIVEKDAK